MGQICARATCAHSLMSNLLSEARGSPTCDVLTSRQTRPAGLSKAGVLELKIRNTHTIRVGGVECDGFLDWGGKRRRGQDVYCQPILTSMLFSTIFRHYLLEVPFPHPWNNLLFLCLCFWCHFVCFREQTHGDRRCRVVFYHLLPVSRAV